MAESEFRLSSIAIMDCREFRVYCRACARHAHWWDRIKHTRLCRYAQVFADLANGDHGLFDVETAIDVPYVNYPRLRPGACR